VALPASSTTTITEALERPVFKPTIALFAAVLALVIVASGCGGGYNSDSSAPSGGAAPAVDGGGAAAVKPAQPAAAVAGSAKAIDVDVKDNLFTPATIQAKVGQKITWNLRGQIAHTVTASEGAKFDSGPLNPGQSFSYTPTKAGTIQYLCSFHQGMVGTIIVK
jgi:plastocyanin